MFKVNEIFVGMQGEGEFIGTPSIFVRLYGCNLKCIWCDTTYAIEGNEYKKYTVDELFNEIISLKNKHNIQNVVITGGEPLLQLQTPHGTNLFNKIIEEVSIEIETNGLLIDTSTDLPWGWVVLNVSPKFFTVNDWNWREHYLTPELKERLDVCSYNAGVCNYKFVLESGERREECINNIKEFIAYHNLENNSIFIMSEGQTREDQMARMETDLEWALENSFNYTPRLHVLTYDTKRGV